MYIKSINGLRAVAILLVIFSHLNRAPRVPAWLHEVLGFTNYGTLGVRLFFLLSGFLITTLLLRERRQNGYVSIRKFFMRRVLRIFPCFYAYLLALFILGQLGVLDVSRNAVFYAMLYIQNFNIFQNHALFENSWVVEHSWSLSVEEQFYLLYPFIFKFLLAKRLPEPLLFFAGAVLVSTAFRALNYSYPELSRMTGGSFIMHADFLVYGCGIALFYPSFQKLLMGKPKKYKNVFAVTAIFSAILAAKVEYNSGVLIMGAGAVILLCLFYILLYVIFYTEGLVGRLLETKPFIFAGKLSYSIYVWQQLFLGSHGLWLRSKFLAAFPYNLL